jgi:hypothetical protein
MFAFSLGVYELNLWFGVTKFDSFSYASFRASSAGSMASFWTYFIAFLIKRSGFLVASVFPANGSFFGYKALSLLSSCF